MSGYELRPVASAMRVMTGSPTASPSAAEDVDPDFLAHGTRFFELTWPLVGSDPPREVHERVVGPLDRLGDPSERDEETNRRAGRLVQVREGLAAAHYHRDNIERIERELLRRLREAYPPGSWPRGGSASSRMPVVAHEYMAYLFAARRTLDYLARGVSAYFGPMVHSIKNLNSGLTHGKPPDLAAEARRLSKNPSDRFPELLSPRGERNKSDRDVAAHEWPVEPASLSVVFLPEGPVGITLTDAGRGLLPPADIFDVETATRDEPILTQAIDARLATLREFCGELIDIAVRAEERRLRCDAGPV